LFLVAVYAAREQLNVK